MTDPISQHYKTQQAVNEAREQGRYDALLGSTVLRVDAHDIAFEAIRQDVNRSEIRNVFLATIAGAFTGCFSGALVVMTVLYYVVSQGWIR